MTNYEAKKEEALKRMRKLNLFNPLINEFEKYGTVHQSEPPHGACFSLTEAQKERVREFEERNDALVYHIIHEFTNFGELENFLFVSNYPDEWGLDHVDLRDDRALAYVYNVDGGFADMGSIGIEVTPAAGLKRTW